jgi:hypothetical protein
MADIIVFHHGDDRAAAELFAEAIGKLGFEPPAGYDEIDFEADAAQISHALDLSVVGVVLWSESSIASPSFQGLAALVASKGRLFSVRGPVARPPLEFDDPPSFMLSGWTGDLKHPGLVALANTLSSRYGVRRHWAATAMQTKPQEAAPAKAAPWQRPQAEPKAAAKAPPAAAAKPATPSARFAPLPAGADPREEPVFRSWKKPVPAPKPAAPVEIPAEILEAVAAQKESKAKPAAPKPEAAPAAPAEEPVFKFMQSVRRKPKGEAEEKPARRAAPAAKSVSFTPAKPVKPKAEPAAAPVAPAAPAPADEADIPAAFKAQAKPIIFPPTPEPAPTAPAQAVDWSAAADAFAAAPAEAAPLFVDNPAPAADAASAMVPDIVVVTAPAAPVETAAARKSGAGGVAVAAMTGGGAFAGALAGVASAYLGNHAVIAPTLTAHESTLDETTSPRVGALLGLDAQASEARDATGFTTSLPAESTPAPAVTRAAPPPAAAAPAVQRVGRSMQEHPPTERTRLPHVETDDEALTRALNMHLLTPTALQAYPAEAATAKPDKPVAGFVLPTPEAAAASAEKAQASGRDGALQSFAPQAKLLLDEDTL